MSTLIQTDRFTLSETERSAIEHEMHHYEDPRAASIEALKIVQKTRGWVPDGASEAIGEAVMEGLKGLDDVAYVRFASVYKNFQAADDFDRFVSELRPNTPDE